LARYLLLGTAVLFSGVFCYAIFRETRRLVLAMVGRAMPGAEPGKVDLAAAPRNAMIMTLETGIILLVGLPLLAIFQPFLPGLPSAALFLGILLVLTVSFWKGTADLEGHVKAVSQAIVEALAKQSQNQGDTEEDKTLRRIRKLFPGMGHLATLHVGPACRCAGKTIGEMNLGNRTGAAILVVLREGKGILPTGKDVLREGDVVTLAGTPEAVDSARELLTRGQETE
jgi:CPA2 family monovalent cation:H+ antiporter-2